MGKISPEGGEGHGDPLSDTLTHGMALGYKKWVRNLSSLSAHCEFTQNLQSRPSLAIGCIKR